MTKCTMISRFDLQPEEYATASSYFFFQIHLTPSQTISLVGVHVANSKFNVQ